MIRAGIRPPTAAELARRRRESAGRAADEVRPREGDDRPAEPRDASRPQEPPESRSPEPGDAAQPAATDPGSAGTG